MKQYIPWYMQIIKNQLNRLRAINRIFEKLEKQV